MDVNLMNLDMHLDMNWHKLGALALISDYELISPSNRSFVSLLFFVLLDFPFAHREYFISPCSGSFHCS